MKREIKKYISIFVLLAVIISFFTSCCKTDNVTIISNQINTMDNTASYRSNVLIADQDVDKNVKAVKYAKSTNEYIILYKKLPNFFCDMPMGSVFSVPSNEKSKIDCFNMGFCGILTDVSTDSKNSYIKFSVPKLADVFDELKISTSQNNIASVKFYPENNVNVIDSIPMSIKALQSADINESFSINDFDTKFTYKESDKTSQLSDYNIVAKQLKLKLSNKIQSEDNQATKISGDITLDYPAVKFNLDYDSKSDNTTINHYDAGLITKEKINVKLKAYDEYNLEASEDFVDKISILDLKDATESEKGKIVLGTYLIGYQLPIKLFQNNQNEVSYLSIGIAIQMSLTFHGEVELNCKLSESGYVNISNNSNGETHLEFKGYNYPNPILGETSSENIIETDFDLSASVNGKYNFNTSFGIDVGFCILGLIPIKISNDIICLELVGETNSNDLFSTKALNYNELINPKDISFYQYKSQSNLIINVGADVKLDSLKYAIGNFYYKHNLGTIVWKQYPEYEKFNSAHCNFGNILLGNEYSEEELNRAYYDYKAKRNENHLGNKAKDKTLNTLSNLINDKTNGIYTDLLELADIELDNYNITCYSDGIIYLKKGNEIAAEIVFGKEIYNKGYISCGVNKNYIRQIYSEPDHSKTIKIDIGALGNLVLKSIGLTDLEKYSDSNISYFQYKSSDSEHTMNIFFDDSDNVFLIVLF